MFIVKFICVLYVARRIFIIYALFLEFSKGWNDTYKIKVKEECVKQSIDEGMTSQLANETCDCFVLKVVEKVDYYKFAYGDSKDTLRAIYKKCKAENFR